MGNASIIIVACITFRDGVLATKNNGLLNVEIEGDLKQIVIIKKNNILLLCC